MTTTTSTRPPSTTPNMKPPPVPIAPSTNAPSSSGMSSSSPTIATKRPPVHSGITKQRKDAQRPPLGQGQHSTENTSRAAKRKLAEPYVRTSEHILKKFAGRLPSLVLHLFPTHFRFDQQDGNFGYNSPMKIILDHIKLQTVPHDMLEELLRGHVPFYDGCLIVEIHNHKTEPSANRNTPQDAHRGNGFVPFSLHNYNEHVTPSPYVPYPTPSPDIKSEKKEAGSAAIEGSRSSQGKDANSQRTVFTTVLHPTQLSRLREMAYLATQPAPDRSRKNSALTARDGTNSPATPLTPAPSSGRQPPAKRQKMLLEEQDVHVFESLMIQASEPPLFLEPVKDFAQARTVMKALTHPLHDRVPIRQQGRKRTTAELAADEAQAAEEERVALIMDERLKPSLSANTSGNTGTSDAANDFVPNFSRFKALEDIKRNHEEEALRRREHEQRERLEARARTQQQEVLEKQQKDSAARMAQQQQDTTKQQLLQRQAMAQAQAQAQAQQGRINPMSQQIAQSMQASLLQAQVQQQLLQQQGQQQGLQNGQPQAQVGQQASPSLRGQTPQQSSPAVGTMPVGQNGMPMPMVPSASSQGHAGSPARPPSVLQMQGQAPMARQASQQTQMLGTPQMPQMTPLMPNGQPARHITPQPRPTQASPPPGNMQGTPMMNMQGTPQMNMQQMNPQQQQQALLMQQRRAQMAAHAQAQVQMQGSPQTMATQMSPQQQQAMMQAQQQMGSPQIQNIQGQNPMQNMQAQGLNPQQAQQAQLRAVMQEQYRKQMMQQQSNAQANAVQLQNSGMPQLQRPQQQNMNGAMNGFNPNMAAMAQNMARNPSQAQAAMMMQQQNSQMMNGNQMQPHQMVNVSQAQRAIVNRQVYEKERTAYYNALIQQQGGLPENAAAQFELFRKNKQQRLQLQQAQQQQQRMMAQQMGGPGANMGGNPMLTPGGGQMFQNGMNMVNMQAAVNGGNMDPNMAAQMNPQAVAAFQARQRSMAMAAQKQRQQQAQQAQQAQQGNMMRQAMQGQGMNGQGMNGQGMG